MPAKVALAYHQRHFHIRAFVSPRVAAQFKHTSAEIVSFAQHQNVDQEAVLRSIIGEASESLSPIMGYHPRHPGDVHPTHRVILESLLSRTSKKGFKPAKALIGQAHPTGSIAIIGGPAASGHAKAIFGFHDRPSLLGALPVSFDLYTGEAGAGRQVGFLFDGRSSYEEHFLLTSLPMREQRLISISSLRAVGGRAADLVFSDPELVSHLFARTRGMVGWQALFKVNVADGEPHSIDREFHVFEVTGHDFDSENYALNKSDFLIEHRDREFDNLFDKQPEIVEIKPENRYSQAVVTGTKHAKGIIEQLKSDNDLRADLLVDPEFRSLIGLPPTASNLWIHRDRSLQENPAAFIRRVYADELKQKTLKRPTLLKIDFALAQAFNTWASRHPKDKTLFGPKKKKTGPTAEEQQERQRVAAKLRAAAYRQRHLAEMPATAASKLWINRDKSLQESPAAFIRRVYADELKQKTLKRSMLRTMDFALAQAFGTWVSRHPEDKHLLGLNEEKPLVPARQRRKRARAAGAVNSAAYRQRHMKITP